MIAYSAEQRRDADRRHRERSHDADPAALQATLRRGLLVMTVAVILPISEAEKNPWPLGVAVVAAIGGEIARSITRPRRVPRVFLNVLALACVVYLFSEMFLFKEPAPSVLALAHFLIFLACCKFLEPIRYRDAAVILIIDLLMLIIGGLVSGSVSFGLVLTLALTYGMYWLIRFHQQRERFAVAARAGPLYAAQDLPMPSRLSIAGLAAFFGAILVGTSAAAFVIMPRGLSRQLFGRIQSPISAAVTGYTDQVELRSGGLLESDIPVMRVRLTRDGEPIGGDDFPLYLRGRTFDCYTHGRWITRATPVVSQINAAPLDEPRNLASSAESLPASALITQNIWLEANKGPWIFCLYPPLQIAAGENSPIEQNCDDLSLMLRRYRRQAVHYFVTSPAEVTPRVARTIESEYGLRHAELTHNRPSARSPWPARGAKPPTSIIPSDIPPAIRRVARQLAEPIGDPQNPATHARIAARIREYLSNSPFEHTLNPVSYESDRDRVEQFLLEKRRGHCEFFASAMTLLCQALDIPARVVNGYFGGEYNPVGTFFLVRQKDAHAWVEVYLPDRGWTTFDPSPPAAERAAGRARGILASIVGFGHYLQFEWVTFVVSFDADYRSQLFGRFEKWFRAIDESRGGLRSLWDIVLAILRGPPELAPRQRILYWVMLALALLMVLLLLRFFWKLALMLYEFAPKRSMQLATPRARDARFYDRMLLLLARRGFSKSSHTTPREFALQIAAKNPALSDVLRVTDAFYEVQYGRHTLSQSERARVQRVLEYLRDGRPFLARGEAGTPGDGGTGHDATNH